MFEKVIKKGLECPNPDHDSQSALSHWSNLLARRCQGVPGLDNKAYVTSHTTNDSMNTWDKPILNGVDASASQVADGRCIPAKSQPSWAKETSPL